MLQGHSAILSTFIKPPFVIKFFVLSIFEQPFYTGFTVYLNSCFNKVCYKGTSLYTLLSFITSLMVCIDVVVNFILNVTKWK